MPDEAAAVVSSWSCFNCRRRKARCTRHDPCAQCSKSGLQCVFPSSGRMPTRQHDPAAASTVPTRKNLGLLNRVRQLEATVEQLSSQLGGQMDLDEHGGGKDQIHQLKQGLGGIQLDSESLVYTGKNVWDTMQNEINNLRHDIEDEIPVSRPATEDGSSADGQDQFLFNSGPARLQLDDTLEMYANLGFVWDTYVENVDPFIKILHVPSFSQVILNTTGEWELLPVGLRCLFLAISLAAIHSMSEEEVMRQYGSMKQHLLANYAHHTEKCLTLAGIQYTSDIRVLQSFLIYLETIGSMRGLRSIWILVGLLVRAAGSIGLNRDGASSPRLSPFEVEMRRRLWWHICYLDFRIAQCDLPEMAITKSAFDTKKPRNLNDEDIDPDMRIEPPEREGLSDVSFSRVGCMIWCQSQHVLSLMFLIPKQKSGLNEAQSRALAQINLARTEIRENILYSEAPKRDVHLFIGFIAELILQQYLLVIRHLDIFSPKPDQEAEERHRRATFLISIVCIENLHTWQRHPRFHRWAWVLETFPQWYAIGIILIHVRALPWGPTCEKAWSLALVALRQVPEPLRRENPLGHSLWRMLAAAKLHRENEIRRLKANPVIKGKLDQLSKKHIEFSKRLEPDTGVASFDTAAAAELLAIEISTSLNENDTVFNPHIHGLLDSENYWGWPIDERMANPDTAGNYPVSLQEQNKDVGNSYAIGLDLGWQDEVAWPADDSMTGYCPPDGNSCNDGEYMHCFHADPELVAALFYTPTDNGR